MRDWVVYVVVIAYGQVSCLIGGCAGYFIGVYMSGR